MICAFNMCNNQQGSSYRPILLLLLFLVASFLGHGQSHITFRQLSVREGLSQSSAISVTQDSTGYLWVATQDGLNKYDGRQFTVFPYRFEDITKPKYSRLGKVYTDREGAVWTIPIDGIPHKLDRENNVFRPLTGIADASIIFQDNQFNIWVGTYSQGLYKLDSNTLKGTQVIGANAINGPIYKISQDTNGDILLGTEIGIVTLDSKSNKTSYLQPKNIEGKPIEGNLSTLVLDADDRQWVGTYGDGLYFRKDKETAFHRISELAFTDPIPNNLDILDLFIDSKERLWVATYGRGLYMINFEELKIAHFTVEKQNPRALHYNDILCIYEDYTGTLWFGTDGAGLSYYDEHLEKFHSFINYQVPEDIHIDVVRAIEVDSSGSVWIGTSGKGLTQYRPKTNSWRTFTSDFTDQGSLASDRVMSLMADDENELWIGTQDQGLNIRNKKGEFDHFSNHSPVPLSSKTVWCIYRDAGNSAWLGTREQGLILFDKKKGEVKKFKYDPNSKNSIPSNNIRIITKGVGDNLWIGTESDGIARFDVENETFTTYKNSSESNSLANDNIKCLYFDPNGLLWIGTNGGGLNVLDTSDQRFYQYTVADGLANDVIYAVLPDNDGNLWLSSNKGITKFTPGNSLEGKPTVVNYNNYDGLATEFNTGAYLRDRKGILYYGSLDGFYWFKPDDISDNHILPKTMITGFTVFDKPQPLKPNLSLKHDQNTLSFTFSSMQFSLPQKNGYRYRLLDHEDEWVQAGNINTVRYIQLPPGDYRFQVTSSNYDGIWNEIPEQYAFTIAPPWYMAPWAKIMYLVLLIVGTYGVYMYMKWRWHMKMKLQLNLEEAERLKKLNDFKSKLYTDISHEFRTPLTLISGPVDAKLGEGNLSDSDFSNFSMIKRNTKRLISLVDQLLHLAKLESGRLNLTVKQGNLGLFLGMLASSFEHNASSKNISFKIRIENLEDVWYDEDAVEKIVSNLLTNAFKYVKAGGVCRFIAIEDRTKLQISVKNTVGLLADDDLSRMFGRFYQGNKYSEGAGVGLSLVKELVQLYHGEVAVTLEQEDLIHFRVTLPLGRADFVDAKIIEEAEEKEIPSDNLNPSAMVDLENSANHNGELAEPPLLLLVEDQKEMRDFLLSVWKERYRILTAENGKEGIEKALKTIPDMILTDVQMPICDGIELCNTLKTDERTSHIPIILLTAGTGEEQELKGLRSGADDFVSKPFNLRILKTKIDNLIQSRNALRHRYSQEMMLEAKDIAITPTDEAFLNRLQKVLDERLSEPDFNAASFCKILGMSRMQLHRKLLAFTGLSTTEFIRSQRLKQAAHILKSSDATINEVAYTVGFNTPSYFIKCFKETYKMTPSEYLQKTD
ncbi:response regulator [Flavobacteriaceae bacterium F89]|uniref:histidine kinase n=1 Tax=Cerina litoralis TaxID=2874477 RepID=A0AAE3EUY2_9FLAO|nr:two-component regulator propeller domain-containing protein [Cerina litoralis]MCG2461585.1 response regulator [Cerina litoralis]